MSAPAGRLVAVVEDEDTIREAMCYALKREGHQTEAFGDGADAWNAFARALPDLAVLDIGLPRLDGLELCRRLRARSDTLPIIFVTSREEEFDRVHIGHHAPMDPPSVTWPAAAQEVHLPALLADAFGITTSEARRSLSQGAVRIEGERVSNGTLDVPVERVAGKVLQLGKRRFARVQVVGPPK